MSDAFIRESGVDAFTSVQAFVGDGGTFAGDIGTLDEVWTIDDATQVQWSKSVRIVATGPAKQPGRPFRNLDTHYRHRIVSSSGNDHSFVVTNNAIVDLTDLDIQSRSTGSSDELFRAQGASPLDSRNCMLGFVTPTDQQDGWYTENASTRSLKAEQCFWYNIGRSAFDLTGGGQGGTVTIETNTNSSFNIGQFGGRNNGVFVGLGFSSGDTVDVFCFNSPLHNGNAGANTTFNSNVNSVFNVDAPFCIHNKAFNSFINNATSSDDTGLVSDAVWATSTGGGNEVLWLNVTDGTYDPTLVNDALNNNAQQLHNFLTDAGLTVPLKDIQGRTRATGAPPINFVDAGVYALTLAAGGPDVDGDLDATEQQDVAAFAGDAVRIHDGDLDADEQLDTATFDGTVVKFVDGDLDVTEQQDISAFAGSIVFDPHTGGISAVEQQDDATFAGEKTYVGDFDSTEQLDLAAFAGDAVRLVDGDLDVTEQQDTPAFNGSVFTIGSVTGSFAPIDQQDTLLFDGVKTYVGDFAALENLDIAAFSGTAVILVDGDFAATDQIDTMIFQGDVVQPPLTIEGSFLSTEQQDAAEFAGVKTYFGQFSPTEQLDILSFSGTAVRLVDGDFAVTENLDSVFFTTREDLGVSDLALRDGNMGIGASAQTVWRDGAPITGDGINLPQGIGLPLAPVNFVTATGAIRQARLLQAIADTPAGVDVLPEWFCDVDVKAGEWVWCVNRTKVIANIDNPIGKDDVTGT